MRDRSCDIQMLEDTLHQQSSFTVAFFAQIWYTKNERNGLQAREEIIWVFI